MEDLRELTLSSSKKTSKDDFNITKHSPSLLAAEEGKVETAKKD